MSHPSESEPRKSSCQLDVAHWYRRVYALCQSKLIFKVDAEDATQETFLRALARRNDLRTNESMGAWLRQTAHNVCVDMIRKNRIREVKGNADAVAEKVSEVVDTKPLTKALEQLDEPLREVILLHYYEKQSYDQMAEWLGVARSTVNDRLRRARGQLKHKLIADRSKS